MADRDILIQTLLGEARGEGVPGMVAVANVITNRTNNAMFPDDPVEVVLQPYQFSTWNAGQGGNQAATRRDAPPGSAIYNTAGEIVDRYILGNDGAAPDLTGGSLYYHVTGLDWTYADAVTTQYGTYTIGHHTFYPRDVVPQVDYSNLLAPVGTLEQLRRETQLQKEQQRAAVERALFNAPPVPLGREARPGGYAPPPVPLPRDARPAPLVTTNTPPIANTSSPVVRNPVAQWIEEGVAKGAKPTIVNKIIQSEINKAANKAAPEMGRVLGQNAGLVEGVISGLNWLSGSAGPYIPMTDVRPTPTVSDTISELQRETRVQQLQAQAAASVRSGTLAPWLSTPPATEGLLNEASTPRLVGDAAVSTAPKPDWNYDPYVGAVQDSWYAIGYPPQALGLGSLLGQAFPMTGPNAIKETASSVARAVLGETPGWVTAAKKAATQDDDSELKTRVVRLVAVDPSTGMPVVVQSPAPVAPEVSEKSAWGTQTAMERVTAAAVKSVSTVAKSAATPAVAAKASSAASSVSKTIAAQPYSYLPASKESLELAPVKASPPVIKSTVNLAAAASVAKSAAPVSTVKTVGTAPKLTALNPWSSSSGATSVSTTYVRADGTTVNVAPAGTTALPAGVRPAVPALTGSTPGWVTQAKQGPVSLQTVPTQPVQILGGVVAPVLAPVVAPKIYATVPKATRVVVSEPVSQKISVVSNPQTGVSQVIKGTDGYDYVRDVAKSGNEGYRDLTSGVLYTPDTQHEGGSGGRDYGADPGQVTSGLEPGDRAYNFESGSWELK